MSLNDTTKKKPSGAAFRRARVEKGLPRFSTREREVAKRKDDQERAERRAEERRSYASEIKLKRGCNDCGYNAHPHALEFDHLPGFEKISTIASICAGGTMEGLIAEIAKCEVVCANCHRIRTAERRQEKHH